MEHLFAFNWAEFFIPKYSILEMIARGTVMYLALFVFLRLLGRRQSGSLNTADVLVIVLLADAAQNGMANDYHSVTEGLVLVLTILGWNILIDWLAFRVPALRPILNPPALCLIKNGVMQKRNMRRELITHDELLSHLRQEGVESPADVKIAQLEEDGTISVIKRAKR